MASHLKAVAYFPVQGSVDHGLMRAFTFDTPKTTPCQTGSTENAWKKVTSAQNDLERLKGCAKVSDYLPFVYNSTVEKDTTVGLSVASNAAEATWPGAKKMGTAGATRDVNKAAMFNIDSVHIHYLDDSADALGLAGFLKMYACQYVSADNEVESMMMGDAIEHGRRDVIIGFEHGYLTGNVRNMSLSSHGAVGLGFSASAGPVEGKLGVSHKVDKSRKSVPDEGVQNAVVGSRFIVVHLQRRVTGTGADAIRMVGGPRRLVDLDSNVLEEMFHKAFPSLVKRTQKTGLKVLGKIFRKLTSDKADQQDNMEVDGNPESRGGKEESDDDDNLSGFFSVNQGDLQLYDDQSVANAFQGSWNYIVNLKKKTFAKMQGELAQRGTTTYGNLSVSDLSLVREIDLSEFIPIYFNWEANKDCDPSEVPSHIICYKTPEAGSWCLRPVEGGKKKIAVTIFDEVWQLRESIVRVSTDNKHLQEELGKIGFHFVEEGQEDLEAVRGSIMMGRHELTGKRKLGTTIPDIETEFRDGLLCTS